MGSNLHGIDPISKNIQCMMNELHNLVFLSYHLLFGGSVLDVCSCTLRVGQLRSWWYINIYRRSIEDKSSINCKTEENDRESFVNYYEMNCILFISMKHSNCRFCK